MPPRSTLHDLIVQEHVQVAKLNLEYALERPELVERVMPAIKLVSIHK